MVPRQQYVQRGVCQRLLRLSLDKSIETEYRCPTMGDPAPFLAALDTAGFRLTDARRTVATLIADRDGPFTAADLLVDARSRRLGIGRATVFRALDAFSGLNVVERLDLPSGEHAYVVCEPAHHHHIVCERCGRTTEIDDGGIRDIVRAVERRTGFRVDSHRLELFGRCAACASA
jgi:Fur family ferric uptake transcriptional regulator